MKKPALIASITAGVVLLGGGAWAATTLPASDDETVASEAVEPTPETTATPSPTPETTPTVGATAGPVVIETTDPAPDPTDGMTDEEKYVYLAGKAVRGWGVDITDNEVLSAGQYYCEQMSAGVSDADIVPLDGAAHMPNSNLKDYALDFLC